MTVSLHEVTIRYGSHVAVAGVSAEFPSGAVGLLGRNGAGKSSILKALLGLVRPASGRMEILGLTAGTASTELRAKIGYMPERDGYIPGLNGYEAVALAGRMTGLPALVAARRAHEVLYLVGLDEQRYRAVASYSTGMRQKVKLAIAMVHDPEVLFLDEPTNGLDPGGRVEMLRIVRSLATDLGKSVIVSSHILQDVERVCDSVVVLEQGSVVASGPLEELKRSPVRVYELETDAPSPELVERLTRAGAVDVETTGTAAYRLTLPEDLGPRHVFAAAVETGIQVRRLLEKRRSLEEVFLGAVAAASTDGAEGTAAASEPGGDA